MIETTVPEINVNELMERVRTEAKRPRPPAPRPSPVPHNGASALPPVAMLPAAPAVWVPGPVKSNKERLDRVVDTARQKNQGASWVPKFLRRFFRKQGGYNRAVLDGVAALAKSNDELTRRMTDFSVCLGQLNSWAQALHEQSDADANWMKAAAPTLSRIATLESELNLVANEVQAAQSSVDELRVEAIQAGERAEAIESGANDRIASLREALEHVRSEAGEIATLRDAVAQVQVETEEIAALREAVQQVRTEAKGIGQLSDAIEQVRTETRGIGALRETVEQIRTENHGSAGAMAQALEQVRADWAIADGQIRNLRTDLDHAGAHLRNLQAQTDAMGRDFDKTGTHLRNLQAQTDGIGQQLTDSIAFHDDLAELPAEFEKICLHLRNLQAQADRLGVHVNNLQGFVEKHGAESTAICRGMEQRLNDQAGLAQRMAAFEERTTTDAALIKGELSEYGILFRRLLAEKVNAGTGTGKKTDTSSNGESKVIAPGLDSFYLTFENRFRGSRSEIKKRVEFYLPFLRKCRAGNAGRPILDVGCGRGEWLELLKANKLEGRGVDANTAMISQCKARHLKCEHGDAFEYLRSLGANTLGAITGFHIIEHLAFENLLELFGQARRLLKPGGVAIFESPNCKNLIVGACNFYIDPTHRNPVFPETAELMLASQGFEKIRIEYLSPVPDVKFDSSTPELAKIKDLLYGPQDFGIIAYKPTAK